jgi:type II restriction/modification system DNA methylase subunit YeeA
MPSSITPEQFIRKWKDVTLSERSASQQHFLDLCALIGEPTPVEADPSGDTFTFEKGGTTATGGHGWADVWKRGAFAWEYKGPGKDLNAAYLQLKKYADMLENPPLLITSDTKRIEIHTNFTNTVKVMYALEIADLADPAKRELLRSVFVDPEKLRPGVTRQQVTTEAASTFSELAHHLQVKGYEPKRVAHFLNRIIFCMFAEDVGLLPNRIFSKLATASVAHPQTFEANAKQLFGGMAKGGAVAFEVIDWFNGGLFDDDSTLPLDHAELKLVLKCAELDWSNIEPSIFGTLFERGLDPDKRSQQGAHYTDPGTIMKIVRPVVLEPWEREWETEKIALVKLADRATKKISEAAKQRLNAFLGRLAKFRVLDPACGSGNFLYLALRGLKDFEKRVILEAETLGLPIQFPGVGPEAVLGIEVNPYAAELARVTIWIGELQWMIENGFPGAKNPILKPLDQIECGDAILNEDGSEPVWPKADVIIGNPPFLGNKKLIRELGERYISAVRELYNQRVPDGVDLCCYWFEKANSAIRAERAAAAGLVGTNSIRGGISRSVLTQIASTGTIFSAWSDEPWINEGAAVRVSLVSFSRSPPPLRELDGVAVDSISADLGGAGPDWTQVTPLPENAGVAFQGAKFVGAFDVPPETARTWIRMPTNPNGQSNKMVLRRWVNGMDIVRRPEDRWVIDFGVDQAERDAALYEAPFAYLEEHVKKERQLLRETRAGTRWWLHQRPRPDMREALRGLEFFIATPEVAKHRIFVLLPTSLLPSGSVYAIARSDFTCFGILSSRIHSVWALKVGTQLEDRPRYTISTTFEAFPFPEDLGLRVKADVYIKDDRAKRIAIAARRLNDLREQWLNPTELISRKKEIARGFPDLILPKDPAAKEALDKRTLTGLYNANPTWLQQAQEELDGAVAGAYEWEWPLTDDEILKRLFELNQQRAKPLDVRPAAQESGRQSKSRKKAPR